MLRRGILSSFVLGVLVLATLPQTATPSAKGSSCAHPWTMYYSSAYGEKTGDGRYKVALDFIRDPFTNPGKNFLKVSWKAKSRLHRICTAVATISRGSGDWPEVHCSRGSFSNRGWSIPGPGGASCTTIMIAGTNAGIKQLKITVASRQQRS